MPSASSRGAVPAEQGSHGAARCDEQRRSTSKETGPHTSRPHRTERLRDVERELNARIVASPAVGEATLRRQCEHARGAPWPVILPGMGRRTWWSPARSCRPDATARLVPVTSTDRRHAHVGQPLSGDTARDQPAVRGVSSQQWTERNRRASRPSSDAAIREHSRLQASRRPCSARADGSGDREAAHGNPSSPPGISRH